MKQHIITELPSSTDLHTSGSESLIESGLEEEIAKVLELPNCTIDKSITGLELEKKVLKTYSRLYKTEEAFMCSLSELIASIHYIDLAIHWSEQELTVTLNYFCDDALFLKNYNKYRNIIYQAIEKAQYIDSVLISDYELNALKTPNEYVLENAYVECDCTFTAFEKAFKFNNQLIKYGIRDDTTSKETWLSELREEFYYRGNLSGLDTKAGKKFVKFMKQYGHAI